MANRDKDIGIIKENYGESVRDGILSPWVLITALLWSCMAAMMLLSLDSTLPAPRDHHDTPVDEFMGHVSHRHLVNLTSIGPRVAGSYENEVLAVNTLVSILRDIAQQASPHNKLEIDVFSASGAFTLSFLDGMTNIYRGVQSVVGRVRGAGGEPPLTRAKPRALLINCHFDTVPDSPGASDDGAGCAVVLETARALAASPRPLRRPLVLLLNGAEENIMQASHAFITQHKWAKSVRAFVNVEACGSGGREVLFQAGPRDPFLLHVYAAKVPHPFASSLAQELFESGFIPADTDFRVFRDFANISGVDLAWSRNGYVYHTRLDSAERVRPDVLQRTGENILALVQGLLEHPSMESPPDGSLAPVFFDVVGAVVVCLSPSAAAAVALAALLILLPAKVHLNATRAHKHLMITKRAWWLCSIQCAGYIASAHIVGALSAAAVGAFLHILRARMLFYAQPILLAPLYALPAMAATWYTLNRLVRRPSPGPWVALRRGWWSPRALHDGSALAAGALLAAGLALRSRSAFVPAIALVLPAGADLVAHLLPTKYAMGSGRAWCWAVGSLAPALQVWYPLMPTLAMAVPILGRSGTGPVPPDVVMAILTAAAVLSACAWMLPFVVVTRKLTTLVLGMLSLCACTVVVVLLGRATQGAALSYSALSPQRYMVFHTRRTTHGEKKEVDDLYWVPELDPNIPHSLHNYVPELAVATSTTAEECEKWLYCGAPYYLPVLSFISRGHWVRAPAPPAVSLRVTSQRTRISDTVDRLTLTITGPALVVVIASPAAGARIPRCEAAGVSPVAPREGPRWGPRRTYLISMHDARLPRPDTELHLDIEHAPNAPSHVDLSVAGHALFGPSRLAPAHAQLLRSFPEWVAATGWGVDMHLMRL